MKLITDTVIPQIYTEPIPISPISPISHSYRVHTDFFHTDTDTGYCHIITISFYFNAQIRAWGICKFVNIHPGHFATNSRSIGSLVKIWGVIPRLGSPNLPLGFDQNLENPKIGPLEPFSRGPPNPEF